MSPDPRPNRVARRSRRAAPSSPASRSDSGSRLLPSVLALALLVALAYSNSLRGPLVLDDVESVAGNASIRSIAASVAPPPDITLSGRPIASLTFALNYLLAPREDRDVSAPGTDPGTSEAFARNIRGYRLTNVLIHLLAALLLLCVTRQTLMTPRLASLSRGRPAWLAFAVAALWAVHPLHTAAITYLVQRVEALMAVFYLGTLYAAIRAWSSPRPARWRAAAVASCALGMATKETMVTAPVMVLAWDLVFGPTPASPAGPWQGTKALLRHRASLYAGLAASWAVLALLVLQAPRGASVGLNLGVSPAAYLLTQGQVLVHYLRAAFIPVPLCLDYDWPIVSSFSQAGIPASVVAVLVALTVAALRWRPAAGFAGLWALVILAPTSTVLPVVTEVAADHRMYLPLAGVIAGVVLGVWRVIQGTNQALVGKGAVVAVAVALGALSLTTRDRNRQFETEQGLWAHDVQACPSSARARTNYAAVLIAEGRYPEAETHLRAALAVKPETTEAQASLGVALAAQQRTEEGIAWLSKAAEARPDDPIVWRNLGEAYASLGRDAEAARSFLSALQKEPDSVGLLNTTAWLLATSPDPAARVGERALNLARRALGATAGEQDAISLDSLGVALAEVGRFPEAAEAVERAIRAAEVAGNREILRELHERLRLYRAGQPFRQPLPR